MERHNAEIETVPHSLEAIASPGKASVAKKPFTKLMANVFRASDQPGASVPPTADASSPHQSESNFMYEN
ncbi:MAG: hypothetical protein JSS56_04835 [Proteobacteria bacterium]|nr:hypothetical protein [Pseudomonadota bacterium]